MNKFKSRKFGLTVSILLFASLFLYVSKLTGGEWITICTLVLGMYKTANVIEHKDESTEND